MKFCCLGAMFYVVSLLVDTVAALFCFPAEKCYIWTKQLFHMMHTKYIMILYVLIFNSCTSTDSSENAARVIGWLFVVIGVFSVIGFIISVTERIKKANRKRNARENARLRRLRESTQNNETQDNSHIDHVDFIAIDFETANYESTSICPVSYTHLTLPTTSRV